MDFTLGRFPENTCIRERWILSLDQNIILNIWGPEEYPRGYYKWIFDHYPAELFYIDGSTRVT